MNAQLKESAKNVSAGFIILILIVPGSFIGSIFMFNFLKRFTGPVASIALITLTIVLPLSYELGRRARALKRVGGDNDSTP